jgi:hypothetical protein
MIRRPFSHNQAVLPTRKARRYSAVSLASVPERATRGRTTAFVFDQRAVGDPDRAADGDHVVGIGGELLADPLQGVRLEQRVRVDHRHQFVAGDVDARVDRVCAAAVLFAHDAQAGIAAADGDVRDRLGWNREPVADRQFDQIEDAREGRGRPVL